MTDTRNKKKSNKDEQIQIELSDKHMNRRLLLFILFLGIAIFAFGYALNAVLSTEKGWREIEANATTDINCASDFVFLYNLGAGETSATVENKALTLVYTEAVEHAYKIFTNDQVYADVHNVGYLNQHPNEETVVDETLYQAFALLQQYENRSIYLAPVYQMYDDMFYAGDDLESREYDPYVNEEAAVYYAEIAAFARNAEAVDLQLLGNNTVKLAVSEEYLAYAQENGIISYIDFFWMKNAFITDYLAECMVEKGYTLGSISSFDGFSRNLDNSNTSYSFNIYDRVENTIYPAAVMKYSGTQSIVYMRDYMMNELDVRHYRALQNGETRTSYLDMADGKCRNAIDSLVSYSETKSCAEVLLNVAPIYIAEEFEETAVERLADSNIYSVYCMDMEIHYNDTNVTMTDMFEKDGVKYTLAAK